MNREQKSNHQSSIINKQYSILLVDDESLILKTVSRSLEGRGYNVTEAASGEEAVELMTQKDFGLVITDLVMENIDGFQVLKTGKELDPDTMVIILTGYGEVSLAIDALRLGADDYLIKPCEPEEIYFRVRNCLEKLDTIKKVRQGEEERKKMEVQLHQARKMKAIATLAGGIAHKFNNALYAITGNVDLLEMDFPGDEKVADYTKATKDSVGNMIQLTAQLLAYARGGKYQAKTVILSDFVRETLPLVKHALDPSVYMDTDLPNDIFSIKADLTQIQMVLSAVLANASEAMEGMGLIRISCKNEAITDETLKDFPGLKPGAYASLTIEDDGKGMDKETRSQIFEPFFTTNFTGRGLGMAAAYGIVKNHDGWISVDSELGKGTIVKIYLPAVAPYVKEDAKQKTKPEWIKGTGVILVIEDEEPVMKVTRAILERLGYSVLEAKTGQEANDVVKNFDVDIDLAMLDVLLPDMDGNAIYPLLMEARPDLKVIVFSGYAINGPVRAIIDAGAQDFIQKPFSIAALSEKLQKVLKG